MKKKAIVAMSGGLDSSVTALLLQQQGYEVIGVTGLMLDNDCSRLVCENANKVARKLGIEHHILDVTNCFKHNVVDYFENYYRVGKTPNPCIRCNKFIKWGEIFELAMSRFSADIFSTGHYADVRFVDGVYKLYPAKDTKKDQLYFLYELGQSVLSKTIFPLYKYEKSEVREIAEQFDLPSKSSKDSQDICFIQKPNTTKKYLLDKFGEVSGCFVEKSSGKIIGKHQGFYQYTVGQRKGIGIAYPYPLYVLEVDANNNIVYLGSKEECYKTSLKIKDVNLSYPVVQNEFNALIKIRYNMLPVKGKVALNDMNAEVTFEVPLDSVTSGQACVFYDVIDGHLIGGGEIV